MKLLRSLLVVGMLSSCHAPNESNLLDEFESLDRTLEIDQTVDPAILGGAVSYRITDGGELIYKGKIAILSNSPNMQVSIPFQGKTFFLPKEVKAGFYGPAGSERIVKRMLIKTNEFKEQRITLDASSVKSLKSDSPDAKGQIVLKRTGDTLAIESADFTGTIFAGTEFQTKVRIKLKESQ